MITDLKRIVEAVLFAAETPLSLAQICQILETKDKAPVQNALQELSREYDFLERAFELVEVAGGWRLRTRPDMAFWLRKLKRQSKTRLSRASLETLAIIAYKQPVLKAEIERIRGVEVSGVLRMLMEKDLVRVVGRKDLPGRPLIYGTTKRFLEVFDLKDLSDLPTLEEMQELLGEPDVVKEEEEEETPLFTRGMAGQDGEQAAEGQAEGQADENEPQYVVELGEEGDGLQEEAAPEQIQEQERDGVDPQEAPAPEPAQELERDGVGFQEEAATEQVQQLERDGGDPQEKAATEQVQQLERDGGDPQEEAAPEPAQQLDRDEDDSQEQAAPEQGQDIGTQDTAIEKPEQAAGEEYNQVESTIVEARDLVEMESAAEPPEPEPAVQANALTVEPSGYQLENKPKTQEEPADQTSRPEGAEDAPGQSGPEDEPGPQAA